MRAILQSAVVGLGLAFAISAAATAAEVAPADVKFTDDMTVEASLTGTAGDPAKGREVFANRRLGNCLACHANTDMKDQLFHGDVGPSLDGVASRWNEAQLRAILVELEKGFHRRNGDAGLLHIERGHQRARRVSSERRS